MADRKYIDDCLSRKIIFFTGKGGVGKSSLTWATALLCKEKKLRVAVSSWSPLDNKSPPAPLETMGIDWLPLETLACFKEYALQILKFEKVYSTVFENHVLKTFIKAAPGLSETVIAGKLFDVYRKNNYDLVLVDLPSSGHALSFFKSPVGIRQMIKIGFVNKLATHICDMFQSADVRLDLVALPEELPVVEGLELKKNLSALLPFHFGYLHMNQVLDPLPIPNPEIVASLPELYRENVESFRKRLSEQAKLLEKAESFEMPLRRIPRFTSEHSMETVRNIAQVLRDA